jgi:Uncharacterized protein conserved in bacteria
MAGTSALLQNGADENSELRAKAQKELGDRFDIRAFHDAVLDQGPLPLDVLETKINSWIVAQKAR